MSFSLFDPESPGVRTGAGHQWPSAPGSDYIHTFLCSWPFCPVPSKVKKRNQSHWIQNQRVPSPWHSGKGKTLDTVKRSIVVRSLGEGWMNGWNTEDFQAVKLLFVVQSLSHIPFFVTPWIVTRQAPLSSTISWVCSNSCPFSWWYYLTISSSV